VQPAVGDPALAGGLDYVTHRGPFQPLPFCDSVVVALLFLLIVLLFCSIKFKFTFMH